MPLYNFVQCMLRPFSTQDVSSHQYIFLYMNGYHLIRHHVFTVLEVRTLGVACQGSSLVVLVVAFGRLGILVDASLVEHEPEACQYHLGVEDLEVKAGLCLHHTLLSHSVSDS